MELIRLKLVHRDLGLASPGGSMEGRPGRPRESPTATVSEEGGLHRVDSRNRETGTSAAGAIPDGLANLGSAWDTGK